MLVAHELTSPTRGPRPVALVGGTCPSPDLVCGGCRHVLMKGFAELVFNEAPVFERFELVCSGCGRMNAVTCGEG